MRVEFHDLELDTTIRALQALEALGKCAIVQGDSDDSLVCILLLIVTGTIHTLQCYSYGLCTSFLTEYMTMCTSALYRELNLRCKLIRYGTYASTIYPSQGVP